MILSGCSIWLDRCHLGTISAVPTRDVVVSIYSYALVPQHVVILGAFTCGECSVSASNLISSDTSYTQTCSAYQSRLRQHLPWHAVRCLWSRPSGPKRRV